MRLLTPALFLAAAAYVAVHNGGDPDSIVYLPLLAPLVGDEVRVQGWWTAVLFSAIGGISLINVMIRSPNPSPDHDDTPA